MGRTKVYENSEEAKTAQKEQIKKSNQKYQADRKAFRSKAFPEQLELVKLLNKNIINDEQYLQSTLTSVRQKIKESEISETGKENQINETGKETGKENQIKVEEKFEKKRAPRLLKVARVVELDKDEDIEID
jgi:hypothetical protein